MSWDRSHDQISNYPVPAFSISSLDAAQTTYIGEVRPGQLSALTILLVRLRAHVPTVLVRLHNKCWMLKVQTNNFFAGLNKQNSRKRNFRSLNFEILLHNSFVWGVFTSNYFPTSLYDSNLKTKLLWKKNHIMGDADFFPQNLNKSFHHRYTGIRDHVFRSAHKIILCTIYLVFGIQFYSYFFLFNTRWKR